MVYESDFYTTRRPYSRPLASSYSVTSTPIVLPLSSIIQLRGAPRMPYVAHKRLVSVIHWPVHNVYYTGSMIPIRIHSRVRPSVIAAELKRIRDLPRPSTESYTEHFLNSRDKIYFDDEAKEIRARVDSLLRRVHVFVPRASPSDFAEEIIPERMRSGDYVRRLISGRNNAKKDVEAVSWYDVPERGNFGNLACVKYVAGKPQSVRRPYYKVADLRPSDIKNDVNFLSYYQKNRQAAATASPDQPMTEREIRKARALETEWSEQIATRESKKHVEEPVEEEEPIAAKTKPVKESKSKKSKETVAPVTETSKVVEFIAEPVEPKKEKTAVAELSKTSSKKVEIAKEPPREVPVEVELRKEPGPLSKTAPEPEPVKQKAEPVVEKKEEPAVEQKVEPAVEQKVEPVAEPVPEPVVEQKIEPVPEPAAVEQKVEPVAEPAPEPAVESPVESVPEPVAEAITEPAPEEPAKLVEESVASESVQDAVAEPTEEAKPVESTELVSEQDQQQGETEEVRQEKQDAKARAEEYLRRAAEEARTEEERRAAAEEERLRLEMEEQKAWEALQIDVDRKAHLDEILEQERAEAERKAEEERLEAEHAEIERLEAAERHLNSEKLKALIEEQERMIIEERAEEARQKQEREERLAEVARGEFGESKDHDCSREDHLVTELTDQEMEEKPYEVATDEDTRIEEENVVEDEVEDIPVDPFVEEPDCAESRPILASGGAAIEDVFTSTPEETFEWPKDEDA